MITLGLSLPVSLDSDDISGIEIRTRRGPIGTEFWGRRWMESVDTVCDPAELEYGRRMARKSQVYHVQFEVGKINGVAAENRAEPYRPLLMAEPLDAGQCRQIFAWVESSAEVTASLFAEILPEKMLEELDIGSLVPEPEKGGCTCEFSEGYCRHQVAMHCVVAEFIDLHPWALLEYVGVSRLDLMNHMRQRWGLPPVKKEAVSDHQLTGDIRAFYGSSDLIPSDVALLEFSEFDVLDRLGPPPFFPPNERNLRLTLEKLYKD